ncbi:MAG: hypothetical protein UY44_C0005G0024 [Candidatus Kaiserbacteria bacterium GW2011_GWA2_49_19]|uniref:Aminopeptidase domain-containing protein n=1 Tax=Candidatus Kaiserbacteria bacterium GW2011_GWA2_49_19 TaxID=1618669 RepID=A0A0G1Y2K5_9BACT|nr:MAG: hypothetical protein UY44_C0005G0024 [Candidatus Kaiserbacteria bacterium GW2011_GWA2_49_19]
MVFKNHRIPWKNYMQSSPLIDHRGEKMHHFMSRLYPICRSITGEGTRKTLALLAQRMPITLHEMKSGTQVFDWTVPNEWNLTDAYIKDPKGRKILDFQKSNLHVMGYSVPVHKKIPLAQLKKHVHTLPDRPGWIPYVTSYYQQDWGFCMPYKNFKQLRAGTYEVNIESSLAPGSLTYGECYLPGKTKEEVLLSTYLCHPSLGNDNLSGVVLLTFLASILKKRKLKYSYRFLFIPETIGALAWLSHNEKKLPRIKHGLVVTCVGDSGKMTYKKSRRANAEIDRIVEKMLVDSGDPFQIVEFSPTGSDERQFCSPGFDLPVGSLMRTPYGQYPEYHTSADNLQFVKPASLADSLKKYLSVIDMLEHDRAYVNLFQKGEPQLSKRGLYRTKGTPAGRTARELARLWILNLSDGAHSLVDISLRSGLKFSDIHLAAQELAHAHVIKTIHDYH